MPMTPLDLRNAISHTEIEAGVRRGRRLRAEAVRDLMDRIFHHSAASNGRDRAPQGRAPAAC
ncbi:MAG: hypothetical protein COW30_11270 [Rhodospirillales bacterium CG15_BIG_FIL_POST_REV_8_21_14_020_66_15]|nr:MAG: hypothetical protein COW30_11270 [Rhodospirillales bacterium CG15_BIG_FIL_POST_REV_8_21_14_020_66_15]